MSCTAEEIAAKRRVAQERLKAKKLSALNATNSPDSFKAKSLSAIREPYQPYKRNVAQKQQTTTTIAHIFKTSCTCALLSETRFTVIPSSFCKVLIDTFKGIPSSTFDPENRVWSFSLDDYQLVQDRVGLITDVSIGEIPKYVRNLLNKAVNKNENEMETACLSAIEPTLVTSLLPFQKEGVCFGISKQGRCMIADEMGLGKTYQALAIADFYRDDWPLLVCTTANTRDSWAAKVRELLPSVPSHLIACMTSQQDFLSDAQVLIVSYNLMERCWEKILERKFGVVILDESHTVKNFQAHVTKAALKITKPSKRVILLTGTPALSRPVELFMQLHIIDEKFFTFKQYSVRYCAGKQGNFAWDSTGQSNLPELNVMLKHKFMIRRTKAEVLTELANKSRETIMLDPALIWQNEETKENIVSYAKDISNLKGAAHKEVLMRYYAETGHAKVKAVCAYVKDLIKKEEKFIIFAHHKVMLDAIEKCVSKLNVDHIRIDGSTQNDVRTVLVNHFQKQSKCRVAVLSLLACNTGITLTAAQLVLFAELHWNPSTLAQAESRAHRYGQQGTVKCQYLLARGTADDLIWEMLKNKQQVLNKAGLFNDDLADGAFLMGPVVGEKIDKYVVKTPIKNTDGSQPSGSANSPQMNVESSRNDLKALLDDNDDVFADLCY